MFCEPKHVIEVNHSWINKKAGIKHNISTLWRSKAYSNKRSALREAKKILNQIEKTKKPKINSFVF